MRHQDYFFLLWSFLFLRVVSPIVSHAMNQVSLSCDAVLTYGKAIGKGELWRSSSFFSKNTVKNCPSRLLLKLIHCFCVHFRCVTNARSKASDPMSSWCELYTLLCFDNSFLANSYNQAVILALNHGIRRFLIDIFITSIALFNILHVVSKRSKSLRQSSSFNCSLVVASCRLFSLSIVLPVDCSSCRLFFLSIELPAV